MSGWGPWRREWFSICSAHRERDPECRLCACGHWSNRWARACRGLMYRMSPRLWRWWVNR